MVEIVPTGLPELSKPSRTPQNFQKSKKIGTNKLIKMSKIPAAKRRGDKERKTERDRADDYDYDILPYGSPTALVFESIFLF